MMLSLGGNITQRGRLRVDGRAKPFQQSLKLEGRWLGQRGGGIERRSVAFPGRTDQHGVDDFESFIAKER